MITLIVVNKGILLLGVGPIGNEEFDEEVLHMRQLLKTKLVDMDLSVRERIRQNQQQQGYGGDAPS